MKKIIFISMLILAILLIGVGACKTEPKPQPAPPPAVQEPPPPPPAEEYHPPTPPPEEVWDLDKYFNRNQKNIILDGAQSYTVQRGDTLVSIARRFYGDGSYYPLIVIASDEVTDPDRIEVGMNLTIPVLKENLDDAQAKSSLNSFFADIARLEDSRGRYGTAELMRQHTE